MSLLERPVLLRADHEVADFRCGHEALNVFLVRYALQSQHSGGARTYVACRGLRVVGYYSLTAGAVRLEEAPARVAKGLPRHPVPIVLLARLTVDQREQCQGLGAALLKDACQRYLQACEMIGSRALVTHAKDEPARSFYLRFGFEPSPTHENHLFLLTKDLKKTLSLGASSPRNTNDP